jgi:hypothetical protein
MATWQLTNKGFSLDLVHSIDYWQFNTAFVDSSIEGRLQWNAEDGTLEYGLPGGNVTLQIGQEQLVKCVNETGSTINDGDVVYVASASGSRPSIALASSATGTGNVPIGMATEDIDHLAQGYVNVGGLVRGIDTSAIAAGSVGFLSESEPGTLRATPPDAPNYTTVVGYCLFQSADSGIFLVRVLSAPRMVSLSDTLAGDPDDGDVYKWVEANDRFELAPLPAGGGDLLADGSVPMTADWPFGNYGLYIGDTVNAQMTIGLTINQGASDDEILAFKSSDVVHTGTNVTEEDTYGFFQKIQAGTGGLFMVGISEGAPHKGIEMVGLVTTNITAKDNNADGCVNIRGGKITGGSIGSNDANSNLLTVQDSAATRWIIDADGDTWQSGVATMVSLVLGVVALSEADLLDLTDAGETALHSHAAGGGDLLADGSIPMTADWPFGNYALYIGDTVNAKMTIGLTINQGANDNEILSFKSSDVTHLMTDVAEEDTFCAFMKNEVGNGGLAILAFGENIASVALYGYHQVGTSVRTTSAVGPVVFSGRRRAGSSAGDMGANENIVVIRNNNTTTWICTSSGDTYQTGEVYTKAVRARDGNGLTLADDTDQLGVFVADGGQVGIGSPTVTEADVYVFAATANHNMVIRRETANNYMLLLFNNAGTGGQLGIVVTDDGDTGFDQRLKNNDFVRRALTIKVDGTVGIGTDAPGQLLEVKGSTPRVLIVSAADDSCGMNFQNLGDLWAIGINTSDDTESFYFYSGSGELYPLRLYHQGLVTINDQINTKMQIGLTINQGNYDDEILAFKGNDFAHGVTSVAETDTYGHFMKEHSTYGGLKVRGFSNHADYAGVMIQGVVGSASPAYAPIGFSALKTDGGANLAALAAGEAFCIWQTGGVTSMLLMTGGLLFLGNENVNTNMTVGLTIQQGAADDKAICLKSSDISHDTYDGIEADTYCHIGKRSPTEGGLNIAGIRSANTEERGAFICQALYSDSDATTSTKSSAWKGAFEFWAIKTDGAAGVANFTSDGVMFSMNAYTDDGWKNRWHLREGGDTWQFGNITLGEGTTGKSITMDGTGANVYHQIIVSANRTTLWDEILQIRGYWNVNEVCRIEFQVGGNTGPKDEGHIMFYTANRSGPELAMWIGDNNNVLIYGGLQVFRDAGAASGWMSVGFNRNASGSARFDLIGDTTYTDFGLRMIRDETGANAQSQFIHRGTGDFMFVTDEAARIEFWTNSVLRVTVENSGDLTINSGDLNIGSTALSEADLISLLALL